MKPTSEVQPPPLVPAFKDCRTGLVVMGILQLFCGGFSLLMVLLLFLLRLLPEATGDVPLELADVLMVQGALAGLAVFFVWTGIGSIQGQRWARALMIMASSIWLVCGIFCECITAVILPPLLQALVRGDPAYQRGLMAIILGVYAVGLILVPLAFFLFYRRPQVRLTCERLHPEPSWTDRCPLPVLTMALSAWIMVPFLLVSVLKGSPCPCFGLMLSGGPGIVLWLALVAAWGYVGWGCYRLEMLAWWLLQFLMVFHCASAIISFKLLGLEKFCQSLSLPAAPLEKLCVGPVASLAVIVLLSLLLWIFWCGYLYWIHRYFVRAPQVQQP